MPALPNAIDLVHFCEIVSTLAETIILHVLCASTFDLRVSRAEHQCNLRSQEGIAALTAHWSAPPECTSWSTDLWACAVWRRTTLASTCARPQTEWAPSCPRWFASPCAVSERNDAMCRVFLHFLGGNTLKVLRTYGPLVIWRWLLLTPYPFSLSVDACLYCRSGFSVSFLLNVCHGCTVRFVHCGLRESVDKELYTLIILIYCPFVRFIFPCAFVSERELSLGTRVEDQW